MGVKESCKYGRECFPTLEEAWRRISEFAKLKTIRRSRAHSFLHAPPAGTLTKVRPNGDILRYDPATNIFGVMDQFGSPRTMFKPTDGINY